MVVPILKKLRVQSHPIVFAYGILAGVKLPNQQGASDLQPQGHRKGGTCQQRGDCTLLRLPLLGWTGWEHSDL